MGSKFFFKKINFRPNFKLFDKNKKFNKNTIIRKINLSSLWFDRKNIKIEIKSRKM
jgi:hypothetical protein